LKIEKDLIKLGLNFSQKEEVLKFIANLLSKKKYVKDDFIVSVIERESTFPTGLPTRPYAVAIPHTDSDKVIESKVAFATLKEPVVFSSMGDSDTEVYVKMIFMLAINDSNEQLQVLQNVMSVIQNEKLLNKLAKSQKATEVLDILKPI